MQKTTDQLLLEAIQGLRNDIARMDRDGGLERTKTENLAMVVAANTEQVKQFGNRLEIMEKKFQDKMADVVAPVIESTDNLSAAIEDKKMSAQKMANIKINKPWYKFW